MIGWLATFILCYGLWLTGNMRRAGFVYALVGEVIWTVIAIERRMWDLAFVCGVFALLAIRNWIAWRGKC